MRNKYNIRPEIIKINTALRRLESAIIKKHGENKSIPPIFIIGAPRAGATLVNQIIASAFNIAYIDNISAKFWEAPSYGLMLSNEIAPFESRIIQKYTSSFGITKEQIGPHEFGYFWQKWFMFNEFHELTSDELNAIDKISFRNQIYSMCQSINLPVVFKNTMSLTLQIDYLYEVFPDALFIFCFREPLYNAQSLFQSRIKYFGNMDEWFSVKPIDYKSVINKNHSEQVVYQIYSCYNKIEKLIKKLDKDNPEQYVRIKYINVCHNPNSIIKKIAKLFKNNNIEVKHKNFRLRPFSSTNRQKVNDENFKELLSYTKKYFKPF